MTCNQSINTEVHEKRMVSVEYIHGFATSLNIGNLDGPMEEDYNYIIKSNDVIVCLLN